MAGWCEALHVRISRQAIALVFILALFLGSGPIGVCSIWGVVGVSHDHHEGEKTVVLFEEADHCEQPSVPCSDANEELASLQFSIPVDSQEHLFNSLIATISAPAAEFDASKMELRFEPLLYDESVRLMPVSRQVVFCCFLI